MTALVQGSDLILSGDVGDFGDEADCFTLADVRAGLNRIGAGRKATVRLNSGGGIASEGVAIASLFSAHRGGVEVVVEGIAASAASVAACGAGRIVMSLGAMWMIHEASGFTMGTAEDHAVSIAGLEAVNAGMASIYARKTGKTPQAIAALMAAETWLGADEAVAAKFADAVFGQGAKEPAAFDYQARYRHAPLALIDRRLWAKRPLGPNPGPAEPPPPPKPAPATVTVDMHGPADPAEIAELCMAAEQPEMMAMLVREKASLADVTARLDVVGGLKSLVACAKMTGQAVAKDVETEILSGRLTQQQARDRLFETWVAASEETLCDNTRRTGNGSVDSRTLSRMQMEKLVTRKYGAEAIAKHKEKRNGGK